MWQPQPGWHPLPGGSAPSTLGVWRAVVGDEPVSVKRLVRPEPGDPEEYSQASHFAYWRRAADVATSGVLARSCGLRPPVRSQVVEDDEGITLTDDWVEDAAVNGLFAAHALGRFAGTPVPAVDWLARGQLRSRLLRIERRGGWTTLARLPVADVADVLWQARARHLDALDRLPQVLQHGDPTPANLLGREGDDVVAVDWGTLGVGAVGGDLGYYLLSAREEFEPLLDAYLLGLPTGTATADEARLGATVVAVYTALSRADWALARVAPGEGPLLAKIRHPAVAPYLRSLQRQYHLIEALLGL
ncbi:aminoglycoside phosphotransferase family protein [Nocardioides sp. GY 10127]|uniref:aminoglycoside phosphotransferase family protein n=1 Tax=Nocardioides sp. GY 10127 TaxID=2569762 RepID=UPI0010A88346|nr:aminoglycoside phosphotransferase family protein [Nocardioides sp. GY 10127]TIC86533.1 aminoglycoside phosphotransferase family protein [Nocardioides sp. GY 10127]